MLSKPKIKFHTILHAVTAEEHGAAKALRAEGYYVAFANPNNAVRHVGTPYKGWLSYDLSSYKALLPQEEEPVVEEVKEDKPKRVRRKKVEVEAPVEEPKNDELIG